MRTVAGALSLLLLCHAASASLIDEKRLRHDLFDYYDKDVRPENKTVVTFNSPTIYDVKVHDRDNVIEMYGWLSFEWKDPRVQWNRSDYAGVSILSVANGLLWVPDLAVYNAHNVEDIWVVNPQNLVVDDSGNVVWIPPTKVRAFCILDLTMWPRDTQDCRLKIGSWTHNGDVVDLELNGQPTIENDVIPSLWEILEAKTKREATYYECCPEVYVSVSIYLKVRRNAPSISQIVFVPAICLSLITLFVFLLHPKSGEKIILGGVCVIADLIYLIYIVSLIGHSHDTTPLLVKLALLQLVMATISVLASALVLRTTHNPRSSGIPTSFRHPLSVIAKCLFLGNYSEVLTKSPSTKDELEHSPHLSAVSEDAEKNSSDDYLVLAAITDRVLFLVFLVLCVRNVALFCSVM